MGNGFSDGKKWLQWWWEMASVKVRTGINDDGKWLQWYWEWWWEVASVMVRIGINDGKWLQQWWELTSMMMGNSFSSDGNCLQWWWEMASCSDNGKWLQWWWEMPLVIIIMYFETSQIYFLESPNDFQKFLRKCYPTPSVKISWIPHPSFLLIWIMGVLDILCRYIDVEHYEKFQITRNKIIALILTYIHRI